MKLNYNEKELHQLLQDFHDLTKLTLTLYDPEGEWIFSYPTKENYFCNCIKTSPEGAALCEASDRASFEAAKASGECVIYKCHAGLIEATAPIVSDGFTIGYLMIHAAARIMEACISSILYKKLISIEKQQFEQNINTYILNHLTEDLSVDRLCEHLHLSRRKLYEYSEEFLHCSIAKYIKKMRLQHAQTLLSETNLPISTISEQCGFSDYNYFCRIFKQENGMSARSYRAAQQT